jgi:hypothetical protein
MYKSIDFDHCEGAEHTLLHPMTSPPMVVVGGTGGSGTRLVVHLLSDLGVKMGEDRNHEGDSLPFAALYDRYINPYLGGMLQANQLLNDLRHGLSAHLGNAVTNGPWGWKNPRSIYLLPLWDRLWPSLVYIHVIRDGMVMATSANQAQLTKHGLAVLGSGCTNLPAAHQSMLMWATVNNAAADYGISMGARYLRLRYEDICHSPASALQTIAGALGLTGAYACSVRIDSIRPRDATTSLPHDLHARLTTEAALRRFKYSQ